MPSELVKQSKTLDQMTVMWRSRFVDPAAPKTPWSSTRSTCLGEVEVELPEPDGTVDLRVPEGRLASEERCGHWSHPW